MLTSNDKRRNEKLNEKNNWSFSKGDLIALIMDHKAATESGNEYQAKLIEHRLLDCNFYTIVRALEMGLHNLAVSVVNLKYPNMNDMLKPILERV